MRRPISIAAGMILLAGVTLSGSGASTVPEKSTQSAAEPATCSGSWVFANIALGVRAEPNVNSSVRWIIQPGWRSCRKLVSEGRYDMCGHTNANGWIMIHWMEGDPKLDLGWSGYIPSTCAYDIS